VPLIAKFLVIWTTSALALAICARAGGVIHKVRQTAREMAKQALDSRDAAQAETRVAQAETQDRARFMAEMSHEIRTPLNAILGFADTMREGIFGPLPKGYEDYPGLIHTSGSHLLDLVSDLLDISKIEAGRYEVHLEDIRLDQFLFEATALSSGAARSAGVQIRHEVGLPVTVRGDARAMRQIAFNLVSNAIKFTPKDGSVTLRIRLDQTADQAILEIADDGAGISPADLARIGQPWAQGDNQSRANSRVVRSSGLGLAVVKRLTELQGGRFWLESTLGLGTTAKVGLPLANLGQPEA
jgi:cell cycle sensor histidine kinase DivJ